MRNFALADWFQHRAKKRGQDVDAARRRRSLTARRTQPPAQTLHP
ncbi:msr9671 (plasmid) [Mesorhizobium japonicum MAFF 303099]|uniref:Msr9671 protein n=1 Tax=Mesorhizobium japonicum (strain LMG 29417 / CECT 9101 / MAFF 303099) TaxID=266835 RepID=Q98NZ7_RHILO|nr:msr9671 [Mesorhizobium japonicum MAFF 303099]